ncbi:hypothetical protein ATANTOWER_008887 [Ataeniobius toweri]|uniref:Uncharacterized protein n=1 Tax=Ataeniobius toweri TaxID=208326 RepID=A0ABU7AE30_9TELE|nr:hypothetical protein [Ataeniobius toweri]
MHEELLFDPLIQYYFLFPNVPCPSTSCVWQGFNKNNLILEERNKYFNPQLAGKTYTNAYFSDLNTYDDY